MKYNKIIRSIIVSTFICISVGFQLTQAQEVIRPYPTHNLNDTLPIYYVVENMPVFNYKGCSSTRDSWIRYISDIARFPSKECSDKIFLRFVVEPDSTISDAIILWKGPKCPGYDREVEKIIVSMPRWIPGKQKGISVRVVMTMPIIFDPNQIMPPVPKMPVEIIASNES